MDQWICFRYPYSALICWLVIFFLGYYFSWPWDMPDTEKLLHPSSPVAYHTQLALLQQQTKIFYPQAIVFIIMGELAKSSSVEDVLQSVRLIGHWEKPIVVLTDHVSCFGDPQFAHLSLRVLAVPSKSSLIEIKAMKAEIFQYLPADYHQVLYMDVDILVTRNLNFFLQDLSHLLYLKVKYPPNYGSSHASNLSLSQANFTTNPIDMAAFLDAKGHYVGFCSGCEKWHTGVLYMVRSVADKCLAAWASTLRSGKFDTDQESLDYVENTGNCTSLVGIPSRHLLFAKDYIGTVLTSGQTFVHLTSANRLDTQDYFYKDIVVPRIRNSLHPPLRPYAPPVQKIC